VNFILFTLIIITIIIALLFVAALRVKVVFDTERTDLHLTLLWLYPFIKVLVTIEDTKPVLSFYLFKKNLFKKIIKKGKSKSSGVQMIKIINPKHVSINANYGFRDPSTTGIACGAINVASQFINIESINHNPDFITESDYIYLNATANVNLGTALINLLKQN